MDDDGALRLFSLDPPAEPPVELHITDTTGWDEFEPRLGLPGGGDQPWRRAEARNRRAPAPPRGRRRPPRRATSSCSSAPPRPCGCSRRRWRSRACRPTSSAAAATGRRSRSATASRGCACSRTRTTRRRCSPSCRSPFHGADTDELVLLAEPRAASAAACGPRSRPVTRRSRRLLAAEREHAERAPLEVLLERAIVATGYDLATLARPGGDRRLANLRKLMRLAGEYERAEGRDLRGFLADAAGPRPRRGARGRGRARVRRPGRHPPDDDPPREGPRVPGRRGRRPRPAVRRPARAAARRRRPHRRPAPRAARRRRHDPHRRLGAPRRAGRRGRRRGGAPPLLRRHDPRPRAADPVRRHGHDQVAGPAQRRPADRLDRARAHARRCSSRSILERHWEGRLARLVTNVITPETLPGGGAADPRRAPQQHTQPTALPSVPAKVTPHFHRGRPAPQRLSYSQLSDYAKCGYRFYLKRVLNLPDVAAAAAGRAARSRGSGSTR